MPVEVTDVIDGANAAISSLAVWFHRKMQRCLLARKPGDARYMGNFGSRCDKATSAQSR